MTTVTTKRPVPTNNFTAAIEDLGLGQCASRAEIIDPMLRLAEVHERIADMNNTMRNKVSTAVSRAQQRTGNRYNIEIVTVKTNGTKFYLVAIVSRVE